MRLDEAIRRVEGLKPVLGEENRKALDVVIEETKPGVTFTVKLDEEKMIQGAIMGLNGCARCLRQGCEYRDPEVVRVNCPLLKTSAV